MQSARVNDFFGPRPDPYSDVRFSDKHKALIIPQADDSVIVQFGGGRQNSDDPARHEHGVNLAEFIEEGELSFLAERLIEGIDEDSRSREEWLRTRANGLKLLGIKVEESRSDLASSSAPMEGMSTVRHPLLMEACLNFQATARGEMLPAEGPAKTKVWGKQTAEVDKLAESLASDLNFFLTKTATEFVPDTDRMLFMLAYSGMSFKKVFRCPIRRRPVSECVDAEHLIVNNTAVDIQTAPRVTHVIPMQQTTFRRMQLANVYRETDILPPDPQVNPFDAAKARGEGINLSVTRPEDQVHTIYEVYTDIDLLGFEHEKDGEPTGLPLPYRVSIEATSRKILEIRRDWKEGDEDYTRKRTFVPYSFVPFSGFYAIGLLQILGNSTSALTGVWRLLLDAGMFSNFPGFLVAKTGARQVSNNFRVPPGSGLPVEVAGNMRLSDAVMALPYKGPDPALMQLADNIAAQAQKLAGTAELPTTDANREVPVGTMLAAIEHSAIVLDAVHKRLHTAQGTELELICDLLREDPEALWRGTPNRTGWDEQLVLTAFAAYNVVPRSDPNIPSHIHRLMKATALGQIALQAPPGIFDPKKILYRILTMMRVDDAEDLFLPEQPPKADPMEKMVENETMANQIKAQSQQANARLKMMSIQSQERQTAAKLQSAEKIEQLRVAERLAVHPNSQNVLG